MSEFYDINYNDFAAKFTAWFLHEYGFEYSDGDFKQGDTTEQEQFIILRSGKGLFRNDIKLGIAIDKYLVGDIDKINIKKEIQRDFEYDGLKVRSIYVITQEDIEQLNITDPEILSILEQDKYIISIDAYRNNRKDDIMVNNDKSGGLLAFIRSLLGGLQNLNDRFYDYVVEKKEEIKYNSQIIYLQKRINDIFDNDLRRIYISNVQGLPTQYVYRNAEFQLTYVYRIGEAAENSFIVPRIGEGLGTQFSFIVYVPASLTYNVERMNAVINRYKFVDKEHIILTY